MTDDRFTNADLAAHAHRIRVVTELAAEVLGALVDQAATDDITLGGYGGQLNRYARALAELNLDPVDAVLDDARTRAQARADLRPTRSDYATHELDDLGWLAKAGVEDMRHRLGVIDALAGPAEPGVLLHLPKTASAFDRMRAAEPDSPSWPAVEEWMVRDIRSIVSVTNAATDAFVARHHHEDAPPTERTGYGIAVLDMGAVPGHGDGLRRRAACDQCGGHLDITVEHSLTTTTVTATEYPPPG